MSTIKSKTLNPKEKTGIWVHLFFIIFGFICIVPFMIVISASFSGETDLAINGFSVLPEGVNNSVSMGI